MKDGVPSVQVGVGVWPDEMTLPAILTISALPSDEALLFDRISNCTSDILPSQYKNSVRKRKYQQTNKQKNTPIPLFSEAPIRLD